MCRNVILAVAVGSVLLSAQSFAPARPGELTFAEEFDGNALDLTKWSPHDPFGGKRSGELALTSPEAITVSGGVAHITASRPATSQAEEIPFISGVMSTRGTFSQMYGRFEARLRIPEGRGLEARLQLLPVSLKTLPAIDIFHALGSEPGVARFENRWGDERTERAFGDSWSGASFATTFHTVAIEWEAAKIVWFVDGTKRFESSQGVPAEPMYLAVSLAVGGRLAKVPGPEVRFPRVLDIDYIRAYRLP